MSDKLDEIAERTWDLMYGTLTHNAEIRAIRAALDEAVRDYQMGHPVPKSEWEEMVEDVRDSAQVSNNLRAEIERLRANAISRVDLEKVNFSWAERVREHAQRAVAAEADRDEVMIRLVEVEAKLAETQAIIRRGLYATCGKCGAPGMRDDTPKQPCGHPLSDQRSIGRCKHGCIYNCL